MGALGTIIAKIVAATVGRLMEYYRVRDLEKKAARAGELKRHIASMDEADNTTEELQLLIDTLARATKRITTSTEKLAEIRRLNNKRNGKQLKGVE